MYIHLLFLSFVSVYRYNYLFDVFIFSPHWKAVLLGQVVSEEREEWSVQTANALCQRLLHDTNRALDKISHLLQQCDQSVREQLDVVKSLRQEERCILGSCLQALEGTLRQPDEVLSCHPDDDTVS